jgi:hypothetical protein
MTKMVGGAAMYPSRNIIQNAVHSKDNTTLVAAVKAAGLVATLEGPGPFTVFAPTNAAFAQLPPGHRRYIAEAREQGFCFGSENAPAIRFPSGSDGVQRLASHQPLASIKTLAEQNMLTTPFGLYPAGVTNIEGNGVATQTPPIINPALALAGPLSLT